MPQAMTAERVRAEQYDVCNQHECSDTDTKMPHAAGIGKPHRFKRIICQDENEDQGQVQKIPVYVLHYQREFSLASVTAAGFADSACGRIGPERFVIGSAIVIAGKTKSAGCPQ